MLKLIKTNRHGQYGMNREGKVEKIYYNDKFMGLKYKDTDRGLTRYLIQCDLKMIYELSGLFEPCHDDIGYWIQPGKDEDLQEVESGYVTAVCRYVLEHESDRIVRGNLKEETV